MTRTSTGPNARTGSAAVFLAGLLVLGYLVYLPGWSGGFLVDDWTNLSLIGRYGTIDTFEKLVSYLLTGFSGPTGRPVSYASFLLDSNTWPAQAEPFIVTNILLHLLNGTLLASALWQLALRLDLEKRQAAWVCVVSAGLWLLHPLWVSTTLYVVQRMTLLAATFVFAALSAYLYGRRLMVAGHGGAGVLWASFAVAICGPLAVLSKENGVLLPLFLLVVERYVPAPEPSGWGWIAWKWVFLILPAIGVVAYLCMALPELAFGEAGGRSFTPGERLLTEGRILWGYLGALLIPWPFGGGVFADDVMVSAGLFKPLSTIVAWMGIAGLAYLAERCRLAMPALAVAIMFYLTGHLLESTWLQLELRFEHRNYVPAALLFFPLALALIQLRSLGPCSRGGLILGIALLFAAATAVRADLWGRPFAQALDWARRSPTSVRAQTHLAGFWVETGNHAEAARLFDTALTNHPGDAALLVGLVRTRCASHTLDVALLDRLAYTLRTMNPSNEIAADQIDAVLSHFRSGSCAVAGQDAVERMIDAGMNNPLRGKFPRWESRLLQQRAQLRFEQQRPMDAFEDLMAAAAAVPTFDAVLAGAALLGSSGQAELGLRFLDAAPRPNPQAIGGLRPLERLRLKWLSHTRYYQREINEMRRKLLEDIALRMQVKPR